LPWLNFFRMVISVLDIIVIKLYDGYGVSLTIEQFFAGLRQYKYRKDLCLQENKWSHLLLTVWIRRIMEKLNRTKKILVPDISLLPGANATLLGLTQASKIYRK
jgi:hypothetical protein